MSEFAASGSSLFVVLFVAALIVVARRRFFPLLGLDDYSIAIFGWTLISLLLGIHSYREQTANRQRQQFAF